MEKINKVHAMLVSHVRYYLMYGIFSHIGNYFAHCLWTFGRLLLCVWIPVMMPFHWKTDPSHFCVENAFLVAKCELNANSNP